ncbi:phage baseplate assembly protein V [Apibacter raozihei]|uniref:phage baseplate assembly protein V n=1 Tax=Apibacter raozihei TaxID=2500547 RepID=UPI000FE2ABF8|nr:phage baseplate assembly protein V [Apibacter raozihei]
MITYDPEDFAGLPFRLLPEEEEKKYYARYGGSKDNRYGDSHLVHIRVHIKSQPFFTHTHIELRLVERIKGEHEFTLIADPDDFGESDGYLLENSREYLGSHITFEFRQFGKTASVWTGVISSISSRKNKGIRHVILQGTSPSVLMENGLHCRSFEDKTFEEIIQEVTRGYPQDLIRFKVNPYFKESLSYIVQYNQSDFEFLCHLSERFGEYFYYSGEQYHFSSWGSRIVEVLEGEDVYDYDVQLKTLPQKFSYTGYDPQQNSSYTIDSSHLRVQSSENPFQRSASNTSEGLFTVSPTGHYLGSLMHQHQQEIEHQVLRERQHKQNLVYVEATSNNPHLRVGDIAKMNAWMPGHKVFKTGVTPIESYRILEIIHEFSDGGGYINSFTGVPKDLSVPPYYNAACFPKAELQHATVTDNQDPLKMGRVRVQFVWQKPNNQQSPWIQVIQPHAGTGKGTYMNPEIGETVLCAFQGGNAECPVVLGTAYNGGEIAAYYTQGNDIKVIQTRSGAKIVFNDAEGQGSIMIEDPSGNKMFMDGEGNIKVNAPKDIEITAGDNMKMQVGNDLHFTVGNRATLDIMQKMFINTPFMQQLVSNYYHTQAGKALLSSANEIKIESPETFVQGGQKLFLHSDELATLNSQGVAEMKGETKNSLSNISNAYEPQREEIKAKCVVMFRPHDKYKDNPDFGFDWLRAGDSGQKGDNWFGNIMGKYYEADNVTVFKNTNSWNSNFIKDMKMYNKLLRSYTSLNISWKDKWTGKGKNRKKEPYLYPVPVLTLLQGRSALFNLKIQIEEKPKKLTFEFKDKKGSEYFTLNLKEIGDIRKGKYDKFNYFKITCKKESPKEQILYVKADGEICGALKLHPNTAAYQKKIDVVFVKVWTDANKSIKKGAIKSGSKDFFKQNFNQALVIPSIVEEDLDCTGSLLGNEFKKKFCTYELLADGKTRGYKITKQAGLKDYLEKKLKDQFGTKYDSYYRMYFIGEEANWNGFSYFNSQFGVYFASHNKATVAHETMHAMNLPHTFDGRSASAHYTYEVYKTNNLLDYSHHIGIDRFCLFLWQWKILNSKIR